MGADVQNIPMMEPEGLVWGSLFDNDAHDTQEDCWLVMIDDSGKMTGRQMMRQTLPRILILGSLVYSVWIIMEY